MEFRQETENFHTTGLSKWICLNLDAELIYLDWCSLYSFGLCLLAWFEFFSILKLNSFLIFLIYKCNKVQFSCSVLYDSLWPHGVQHSRLPCPSPTPGVCSNSCPLNRWCYPTISSSVISFSSRLRSFPASGSFPISQFFVAGGQSIGVSASRHRILGIHPSK